MTTSREKNKLTPKQNKYFQANIREHIVRVGIETMEREVPGLKLKLTDENINIVNYRGAEEMGKKIKGLPHGAIHQIIHGKETPTIDTVNAIAKACGRSFDEFVTKTSRAVQQQHYIHYLKENIETYLQHHNIGISDMERRANLEMEIMSKKVIKNPLGRDCIRNILTGKSKAPGINIVIAIAKLCDSSVQDLVSKKITKNIIKATLKGGAPFVIGGLMASSVQAVSSSLATDETLATDTTTTAGSTTTGVAAQAWLSAAAVAVGSTATGVAAKVLLNATPIQAAAGTVAEGALLTAEIVDQYVTEESAPGVRLAGGATQLVADIIAMPATITTEAVKNMFTRAQPLPETGIAAVDAAAGVAYDTLNLLPRILYRGSQKVTDSMVEHGARVVTALTDFASAGSSNSSANNSDPLLSDDGDEVINIPGHSFFKIEPDPDLHAEINLPIAGVEINHVTPPAIAPRLDMSRVTQQIAKAENVFAVSRKAEAHSNNRPSSVLPYSLFNPETVHRAQKIKPQTNSTTKDTQKNIPRIEITKDCKSYGTCHIADSFRIKK